MKKTLSILFTVLSILLTNAMCALVAYQWAAMECGIAHMGFSAPASVAVFSAVPFLPCIAVCVLLSVFFGKKRK